MAKAVWNEAVVAESNACEMVDGNHYFPADSVIHEYLQDSDTHTTCPWKGVASYKNVVVGDKVAKDGAWFYPSTLDAAKNIEGYFAFWNGVTVEA